MISGSGGGRGGGVGVLSVREEMGCAEEAKSCLCRTFFVCGVGRFLREEEGL